MKRVLLYIISAILSVAVIVYLLYHLLNGFKTEILTDTAQAVSIDSTISMNGYIFRNEQILSSDKSGGVGYTYDDGEKVPKGAVVANIYNKVGSLSSDKIIALKARLDILKKSNITKGYSSSAIQSLNSRINALYYVLLENRNNGDLAYVTSKKSELLILLNKREIMTNKRLNFNTEIAEVESKIDSFTNSDADIIDTISVPDTGYFYSTVDGYENAFTLEALDKISLNSFEALIKSPAAEPKETDCGKLVLNYKWYIVCEADKNSIGAMKTGNNYTVNFPYSATNASLEMKLENIITEDSNTNALLVYLCETIPASFNFERKQTVEIVSGTIDGLRVPINAVRAIDTQTGVYVLENSVVKFKKADIICENDGYYIVKNVKADENSEYLHAYDIVITQGKDLHDGMVINN